jgi:hypothetical protein
MDIHKGEMWQWFAFKIAILALCCALFFHYFSKRMLFEGKNLNSLWEIIMYVYK